VALQAQEQVEQSADLQDKQHLACSIPGIGRWTAARVLAESEQVRTCVSARRLAKTGNSRLRRALYLPAIVAM
jgi:transposase